MRSKESLFRYITIANFSNCPSRNGRSGKDRGPFTRRSPASVALFSTNVSRANAGALRAFVRTVGAVPSKRLSEAARNKLRIARKRLSML